MMATQTVTIGEAETQLRFLLSEVQSSQQSVILTTDDAAAAPMALLSPVIDDTENREQAMLRHIELIESIIPLWEKGLSDLSTSSEFAQLCHSQLRILSDIIPDELSIFASAVMLLRLTVRTLEHEAKSAQLDAFQQALKILKKVHLTEDDLAEVDQLLLDADLDIQADLSAPELLNEYIDVL